MKKSKLLSLLLAGCMTFGLLTGCSSSTGTSEPAQSTVEAQASETTSDKPVLKVGMECAYAPFNWTQDSATTPDGSIAVPIYDSNYYAYGYDVAVAQMLADEMGMDLEIHKVEWSSIGVSMDTRMARRSLRNTSRMPMQKNRYIHFLL